MSNGNGGGGGWFGSSTDKPSEMDWGEYRAAVVSWVSRLIGWPRNIAVHRVDSNEAYVRRMRAKNVDSRAVAMELIRETARSATGESSSAGASGVSASAYNARYRPRSRRRY